MTKNIIIFVVITIVLIVSYFVVSRLYDNNQVKQIEKEYYFKYVPKGTPIEQENQHITSEQKELYLKKLFEHYDFMKTLDYIGLTIIIILDMIAAYFLFFKE